MMSEFDDMTRIITNIEWILHSILFGDINIYICAPVTGCLGIWQFADFSPNEKVANSVFALINANMHHSLLHILPLTTKP